MVWLVGFTFVHDSLPEPGWRPGPGRGWVDYPRALMRVTAMRGGTVSYTYANGGHDGPLWTVPEDSFRACYGAQLPGLLQRPDDRSSRRGGVTVTSLPTPSVQMTTVPLPARRFSSFMLGLTLGAFVGFWSAAIVCDAGAPMCVLWVRPTDVGGWVWLVMATLPGVVLAIRGKHRWIWLGAAAGMVLGIQPMSFVFWAFSDWHMVW